ncbi:hypothetical protein CJ030_MR3G005764 [Morella rubra]|uniref:Uncharacterized protein n=1 Tax=Morella rubra TaxID=262757 RepID=A0A6A1WAA8_9ROSI|nr:hypothetical protein CJ030_MR3G005759 [Morella rubra]KAB1219755.1 hypothetical protein CJ030_MR3G005764 [Morella rubra]
MTRGCNTRASQGHDMLKGLSTTTSYKLGVSGGIAYEVTARSDQDQVKADQVKGLSTTTSYKLGVSGGIAYEVTARSDQDQVKADQVKGRDSWAVRTYGKPCACGQSQISGSLILGIDYGLDLVICATCELTYLCARLLCLLVDTYNEVKALKNLLVSYKVEDEAYKAEADAKREEVEVCAKTLEDLLLEVSKRVDDEFLILRRAVANESSSEEEELLHVNPLHLMLSTVKVESPGGLLHIPIEMESRRMMALLNTGTSHNFVTEHMAKKLGLSLNKIDSKVKAINSKAKEVVE